MYLSTKQLNDYYLPDSRRSLPHIQPYMTPQYPYIMITIVGNHFTHCPVQYILRLLYIRIKI